MKFIDIKAKYLKKLLILVISFLIVSCEQYKLMNSNLSVSEDTDHLYVYDKSKNLIIIDQLVVDYEIKGDELFVLRMVSDSIDCYDINNVPTIITHYSEKKEYWIINLGKDEIDGPFDENTFKLKLKSKGLSDINLKVPTNYRANTEYFIKEKSACYRVE